MFIVNSPSCELTKFKQSISGKKAILSLLLAIIQHERFFIENSAAKINSPYLYNALFSFKR